MLSPEKYKEIFEKNEDLRIVAWKQLWETKKSFWSYFTVLVVVLVSVSYPYAFFSLPIILILYYIYLLYVLRQEFMKHFAEKMHWKYSQYGAMNSVSGSLFSIGHSQSIFDEVEGIWDNHPTRLFFYRYTVGSGKSAQTYNFTVFEMTFDIDLPNILLYKASQFWEGWGKKELKLEGDFYKYFRLYAPEDYGIEVLQLFTPDVMADLIDKCKDYNLEFCKNKIYIYSDKIIYKQKNLQALFEAAEHICDHIRPTMISIKDDIEALHKYYKK